VSTVLGCLLLVCDILHVLPGVNTGQWLSGVYLTDIKPTPPIRWSRFFSLFYGNYFDNVMFHVQEKPGFSPSSCRLWQAPGHC
jgi:hypothetical protein